MSGFSPLFADCKGDMPSRAEVGVMLIISTAVACERGHAGVVRALLDKRADTLLEAKGLTALSLCAAQGHAPVLELLLGETWPRRSLADALGVAVELIKTKKMAGRALMLAGAPGTVLRGAGRGLVSIYFAEDDATSAPPAYVTSSAPGAWGLEDLTIYVTAFANDIVRFSPGTSGAFMRRCTVRFNSYFCLEAKRGASSRGRSTNWEHDVGCAVKLAGSNLFVTDNDIYSSGDVVSTLARTQHAGVGAALLSVRSSAHSRPVCLQIRLPANAPIFSARPHGVSDASY